MTIDGVKMPKTNQPLLDEIEKLEREKDILEKLKYTSKEIIIHIEDDYIKQKEIPSNQVKELRLNSYSAKVLLDYITNLQEENNELLDKVRDREKLIVENTQLKRDRIGKARKMIFDNYGVLDKYEIEILDDILKGEDNENK